MSQAAWCSTSGCVHPLPARRVPRARQTAKRPSGIPSKKVRLALAEAEKAGAPMPSVGVVRDRLITAIARGYGELDWTALRLIAAENDAEAASMPVLIC